jgi:hypothetical protein
MGHPRRHIGPREACEILDFDEAMLDACPAQVRADVMMEAELLVGVFAPDREPERLARMADQLSAGERDAEMNRAHARRLAAALKRIARNSRAA